MGKRHFEKKSRGREGGIVSAKECIDNTFNPVPHLRKVFRYFSTTSFFYNDIPEENYAFTLLSF